MFVQILQVGGRDSWWPGRIVTQAEIPSELYEKLSLTAELKKIVVSLFNPAQELEPYQIVTRRSKSILFLGNN